MLSLNVVSNLGKTSNKKHTVIIIENHFRKIWTVALVKMSYKSCGNLKVKEKSTDSLYIPSQPFAVVTSQNHGYPQYNSGCHWHLKYMTPSSPNYALTLVTFNILYMALLITLFES